jgi:hypothetical protein
MPKKTRSVEEVNAIREQILACAFDNELNRNLLLTP